MVQHARGRGRAHQSCEGRGPPRDRRRHDVGHVAAGARDTSLFIMPGYRFRIIDALITNFHLPKSTLVMLVSALAGRERILEAYRHAVEEKYRFFSYGDACFIENARLAG